MKDDLISRQAAIDEIRKCRFVVDAIEKIKGLPSAELDLSGFSDKLWKAAYERGKAEARASGKTGNGSRTWRDTRRKEMKGMKGLIEREKTIISQMEYARLIVRSNQYGQLMEMIKGLTRRRPNDKVYIDSPELAKCMMLVFPDFRAYVNTMKETPWVLNEAEGEDHANTNL